MTQALAAAAAFFYGIADYGGGLATRRLSVWKVMAWAQLLGVWLLVLGVVVVPATEVRSADLFFGAIAGAAGLAGLVMLYRSLARGTMAIVAPISGAVAAAIPVLVDTVNGPGLGTTQWVGIGFALVAIVLVSVDGGGGDTDRAAIAGAVVSGIAFGAFYLALGQTDVDSGLWPLVAARGTSIPVGFIVAAGLGVAAAPARTDLGLVAFIGNGDMVANIVGVLALQRGPIGVAVVLISLYPAVTATTAMVLLRERPSRVQVVGIAFALAALVVLVAGG